MSETIWHSPNMNYTVKLNGKTPSGVVTDRKISFITGHNQISIEHICSDQSINNFQVWVTPVAEENWGLGEGVKAYENTNSLAKNTKRTATITANNSIFTHGDGIYRLALCSRGDIDMTWDVTAILIDVNGLIIKPTDADAIEVVVTDYYK